MKGNKATWKSVTNSTTVRVFRHVRRLLAFVLKKVTGRGMSWLVNASDRNPYRSGLRTNDTRAYSVPLFLKRLPLQFSLTKIYFLSGADEGNGRPRKKLGYRTPEDLFDVFRDAMFAL